MTLASGADWPLPLCLTARPCLFLWPLLLHQAIKELARCFLKHHHDRTSGPRPTRSSTHTTTTVKVFLGSRETPNGHTDGYTDAQMSVFNDFSSDLGTLLEHTLATIFGFSVFWGGKLGGSFHIHVFSAPGMEMMPEGND